MIVSLLVAMDEKRGIGKENLVPWRLSADLKQFKNRTLGHHLIMGRKTYESIGRPLPGRTTIIVTRNPNYAVHDCPESDQSQPECLVAHSLDEALRLAKQRGDEEAFIIGGGEIFTYALEVADRIYLTQVHAQVPADVFFPPFDETAWVEQTSFYQPADERNEFPFTFKLLEKRKDSLTNPSFRL